MPVFTDLTGHQPPQRIISLVPSQTELLFDLGLDKEVVGITKFCIHPVAWFHTKTRVGGTKNVNPDVIRQLQPDLIIANKEENVKEQVEELQRHYPVWVSDVSSLDEAYEMIGQIGVLTKKEQPAYEIIDRIKENFAQLPTCLPDRQAHEQIFIGSRPDSDRVPTVYLIWQNPYMTIGGDTFINAMLNTAGFENLYAGKTRYPEINIAELRAMNCDLLLLSSEPFPFEQKHADELQTQLPGTKIILVDGELFSWYGSRLLKAPAYFKQLAEEIKIITGR
ncbi:MAG: ABC transporter substrate-binding protein [Ferruginibacter sp.]|nr:ABC transporter substrate-binding protein [Chitinophagaceae bacterium]